MKNSLYLKNLSSILFALILFISITVTGCSNKKDKKIEETKKQEVEAVKMDLPMDEATLPKAETESVDESTNNKINDNAPELNMTEDVEEKNEINQVKEPPTLPNEGEQLEGHPCKSDLEEKPDNKKISNKGEKKGNKLSISGHPKDSDFKILPYRYIDKDDDGYFVKLPSQKEIFVEKKLPSNLAFEKPNVLDCDDGDNSKWKLLKPLYKDQDQDGYGFGEESELCTNDKIPAGFSLNKDDFFPNDESRHGYGWGYSLKAQGSVINHVVTDEEGYIYITGYFNITISIDDEIRKSQGNQDIFLIKLDKWRNLIWAKTFGSRYSDDGLMVTIKEGDVYLLGTFKGSMMIDDTQITSNGDPDGFVAVFTSDGTLKWTRNIGYKGEKDNPRTLNVTSDDKIVVTGIADSRLLRSVKPPYYRAYVKKFSKEENIWDKTIFKNKTYQSVKSVIDENDDIYVVGSFKEPILFNQRQKYLSNGDKDAYVVKIDKDGNYVWLKTFGGSGEEYPVQIVKNQDGRLVVVGFFSGKVDFDPTENVETKVSKGEKDTFISFFTTDGDYLKTYTFGGKQNDVMDNIVISPNGSMYLNGHSLSYQTFPNVDSSSMVLKINEEGQIMWHRRFYRNSMNSISLTSTTEEKIIITGYFADVQDFDFTDNVDKHTSSIRYVDGYMLSF